MKKDEVYIDGAFYSTKSPIFSPSIWHEYNDSLPSTNHKPHIWQVIGLWLMVIILIGMFIYGVTL
jgi:hypothetical protein